MRLYIAAPDTAVKTKNPVHKIGNRPISAPICSDSAPRIKKIISTEHKPKLMATADPNTMAVKTAKGPKKHFLN